MFDKVSVFKTVVMYSLFDGVYRSSANSSKPRIFSVSFAPGRPLKGISDALVNTFPISGTNDKVSVLQMVAMY